MSKTFKSILIILSILFIYSTRLSVDVMANEKKLHSMQDQEKVSLVSEIVLLESKEENYKNDIYEFYKKKYEDSIIDAKEEYEEMIIKKKKELDNFIINEKLNFDKTIKTKIELFYNYFSELFKNSEVTPKNHDMMINLESQLFFRGENQFFVDNYIKISQFRLFLKGLDHFSIKTLSFIYFDISDRILEVLSEELKINKSLTHLDLIDNYHKNLSEIGMKNLSEALKINNVITHLSLEESEINIKGFEYVCEALKINTAITHLSLRNVKITDKKIEYLSEVLKINKTIKSLNLSYNDDITDKGIQYLSDALKINNSITEIYLNYLDKITYKGVKYFCEALEKNNSIKRISLDSNGVAINEIVASMSKLEESNKYDSISYN